MKIYLKSRDECQQIVKSTDAFYCTETEVQGFKVEMYDYRLASYSDFEKYKAYELRGLTFIYNPETEEWERHIALQKFYNCNQTGALNDFDIELENGNIYTIKEKTLVLLENGKKIRVEELKEDSNINEEFLISIQ